MARAKYPFQGSKPNEMPLVTGQIIEVVMRGAPGGWCKGTGGVFPTDYVEFLPNVTASSTPTTSNSAAASILTGIGGVNTVSSTTTPASRNSTPMQSDLSTSANRISSAFDALDTLSSEGGADDAPTLSTLLNKFDGGSRPTSTNKTFNTSSVPDLTTSNTSTTASNIMSTPSSSGGGDLIGDIFAAPSMFGANGTSTTSGTDLTSASTSGNNRGGPLGNLIADPSLPSYTSAKSYTSTSTTSTTNSSTAAAAAGAVSAALMSPSTTTTSNVDTPATTVGSSSVGSSTKGRGSINSIIDAGTTSFLTSSPAPASTPAPVSAPAPAPAPAATTSTVTPQQNNVPAPPSTSAPIPAAAAMGPVYARVKYTRAADGPNEINIVKDEILMVQRKDGEWWYGSSAAAGVMGFFPGNYVEEVTMQEVLMMASQRNKPAEAGVTGAAPPPPGNQREEVKRPVQTGSRGGGAPVVSKKNANKLSARYSFDPEGPDFPRDIPIWKQFVFLDYFCDNYPEYTTRLMEDSVKVPAILRMKRALQLVLLCLQKSKTFKHSSQELHDVANLAVAVFEEGIDMADSYATHATDNNRMFVFLVRFMERVKSMRIGDILVVPTAWQLKDKSQHAILVCVRRIDEDTENDFSMTIINTGAGKERGLDYHTFTIDLTDASILRNLSFELKKVPNMKVGNTAFWLLVFKILQRSIKDDAQGSLFAYEQLFPFVTDRPLLSGYDINDADYCKVPINGDQSFVHCAFELLRMVGRLSGLTRAEARHLPAVAKGTMLSFVTKDLQENSSIPDAERECIRIALKGVAYSVGRQVGVESDATFTRQQGEHFLNLYTEIESKLDAMDFSLQVPKYEYVNEAKLVGDNGKFPWFGRLRLDADVEHLAGAVAVPPINRPIEMTLVPESVSNYPEAQKAMRHAVELCTLLANQQDIVRNSFTLRICLIQHLFTRVIPLPLGLNHKERSKRCFWYCSPMRYETQADFMRLLNQLARHFAAASLSVKVTRSGDAVRMLCFACMSCVADAILRRKACDTPAYSSLHYSGEALGPVKPFGFCVPQFQEESEYLQLVSPECATARTQVLDYLLHIEQNVDSSNMMFAFEKGNNVAPADKRYIDQLALQMGFPRQDGERYVTNELKGLLDLYPEIGFFRDLIFMLKLVMLPSTDDLPELRRWTHTDAEISWTSKPESPNKQYPAKYEVKAFNRKLECKLPDLPVEERSV